MMRNLIIGIIIGFMISSLTVYAGVISSPPPLPETEVALQQYLFEIYNNMNKPEVVSSDPNGSRNGLIGQIVLFNNSGTYSLKVNTDGSKTWQTL